MLAVQRVSDKPARNERGMWLPLPKLRQLVESSHVRVTETVGNTLLSEAMPCFDSPQGADLALEH